MDCAPPPPALAVVVRAATHLTRQRIGDIPSPRVCIDASLATGSGMATPGIISFGPTPAFAQDPRHWRAPHVAVVLHETLHQVSMARDDGAGIDMALEEGVVEAVTHDLLPVLMRRISAQPGVTSVAYRHRVTIVRRASARATSTRWTSRQAAAWRIHLLAMPPAARTVAE